MPRPPLLTTLRQRLRWGRDPSRPAQRKPADPIAADPLLAAGQHLRQAREAAGLSLRDLAQETRISTTVLEAIERGWRDRLPEEAYLRTMVPLLERRLALDEGSLQAALPRPGGDGAGQGGRVLLRRFTPGSIDVFSSWQGTVLYGALTLGLIYAVNLQQERLASANLLTQLPIGPLAIPVTPRPTIDGSNLLLQIYPDLRPIARRGPMLQLDGLRDDGPRFTLGRLRLQLTEPSRVTITGQDGQQLTELQGVSGTLELPLFSPLTVAITPPPPPGSVLWNGAPVTAPPQQRGQFTVGARP